MLFSILVVSFILLFSVNVKEKTPHSGGRSASTKRSRGGVIAGSPILSRATPKLTHVARLRAIHLQINFYNLSFFLRWSTSFLFSFVLFYFYFSDGKETTPHHGGQSASVRGLRAKPRRSYWTLESVTARRVFSRHGREAVTGSAPRSLNSTVVRERSRGQGD